MIGRGDRASNLPTTKSGAVLTRITDALDAICRAAGIAVAWLFYVRRWRPVPKPWSILEEKFLFDELYDAVFYKPAVAFSLGLERFVEKPLIAGSITEVTKGFRLGSVELGRVQNGLVRSYALVLTSGIAILAVVFISTR